MFNSPHPHDVCRPSIRRDCFGWNKRYTASTLGGRIKKGDNSKLSRHAARSDHCRSRRQFGLIPFLRGPYHAHKPMREKVVLLSIPGLREKDLAAMPNLRQLAAAGEQAALAPSFPCVTCPVQANMTTGKLPREHGVVANGFYWREKREVEMWTAWNDCIHGRRSGTCCTSTTPASPRPCGFRCTARAAAPITSARPRRSTIPTAASRCGATPSRPNCTARCATRWAIFRCCIFGGRWPTSSRPPGSAIRPSSRRKPTGRTSSTSICRTWTTPRRSSAPTARGRSAPWSSSTTVLGRLLAGFRQAYAEAEPAVARGQRVCDRAGRSRALSQPRAARGRAAAATAGASKRARADGGEHLDFAGSRGLGAGRSSVLARLRGRPRQASGPPGGRAVPRPAGHRRSAGRRRAGTLRPRPRALRRGGAGFDGQQLAGVLLVARTTRVPRLSPARSTSTASRATTRWSCSSTRRPRAFRWMPRWSAARTVRRARSAAAGHHHLVAAGRARRPTLADTDVCDLVLRQFGV